MNAINFEFKMLRLKCINIELKINFKIHFANEIDVRLSYAMNSKRGSGLKSLQ